MYQSSFVTAVQEAQLSLKDRATL